MATTGLTSTDELMLQGLYWWDIATFFRCPVERDPGNCDVALVGVPHSTGNGTTERDQHLGPRAVRDVSAMARRVHMEFGIDPWECARIRDMGDVPLPEANDNEACIERITDMALINERIGDAPLYITFDLDCLDPTVAPAVANLEAGCEGFRVDEVMRLLRCVRGRNVIGGDVVCLMPTKDHPNRITAHTTAAIMFEIVSLVADGLSG